MDKSEIGGELKFYDLSENLKVTGFRSVEFKGVYRGDPQKHHPCDRQRLDPGPTTPTRPRRSGGREMLQTTADYIVDFMEEFKKVTLD